jgi:hypothetical protein
VRGHTVLQRGAVVTNALLAGAPSCSCCVCFRSRPPPPSRSRQPRSLQAPMCPRRCPTAKPRLLKEEQRQTTALPLQKPGARLVKAADPAPLEPLLAKGRMVPQHLRRHEVPVRSLLCR